MAMNRSNIEVLHIFAWNWRKWIFIGAPDIRGVPCTTPTTGINCIFTLEQNFYRIFSPFSSGRNNFIIQCCYILILKTAYVASFPCLQLLKVQFFPTPPNRTPCFLGLHLANLISKWWMLYLFEKSIEATMQMLVYAPANTWVYESRWFSWDVENWNAAPRALHVPPPVHLWTLVLLASSW